MRPRGTTPKTIDAYIRGFPPKTQVILKRLRRTIHAVAPDAVETISYRMPTFDLHGKHLVHFAGYAHHVGFYPVPTGMSAFKKELAPYKQGRGSVQFPLDQPIPYDLVKRIVTFRVKEQAGRR